nr:Protein-tyrosine phosphatase domain containing protein [Haemonchus contortus]
MLTGPSYPCVAHRLTKKEKKKDFIANVYHEDVVEHAMDEQKKADGDSKSTVVTTSDNRAMWAQNLILKKPIRALAKEFAANKKIKPSDYTTEAYEKNDAKNRYNDIICIDATRVVLKDRPPEDDYIHASWMSMPDGQKYICTQGPLLEYVGDFWHMITSESSKVIVMLCNFNEGKHEKCCLYLPKEKKEVGNFGGFAVAVKASKPDPFENIKHTELEVKYG